MIKMRDENHITQNSIHFSISVMLSSKIILIRCVLQKFRYWTIDFNMGTFKGEKLVPSDHPEK